MSRYLNQNVDVKLNKDTGFLEIHIYFKQGVSMDIPLEFYDDDLEITAVDFTGYTHSMSFKENPQAASVLTTWDTDGGLTVQNDPGIITLNLTPARTDPLTELSYADLKSASGAGVVHPNHHIRFIFHKNAEVSA